MCFWWIKVGIKRFLKGYINTAGTENTFEMMVILEIKDSNGVWPEQTTRDEDVLLVLSSFNTLMLTSAKTS